MSLDFLKEFSYNFRMIFEEFLDKLGKSSNPDKAYKLYLQTQIAIIQAVLISGNLITREALERIEEDVLTKIAAKAEK